MPTKQPLGDDPHALRLHRMKSSIEALNARIARLAIGLGVSLQSNDEVARVMDQGHASATARATQDASKRLMSHKWEELRGLLVLRYGIETRYVDQVGISDTRQILIDTEEHLMRRGFNLGDDGIDLGRMFNDF